MKLNQSKSSSKKSNARIAIILPRFNDELTGKLLENTEAGLRKLGVTTIKTYRVPGSLELPFAAQVIAKKKQYHAIIALGLVIRGETKHFDLVVEETYAGLMRVSLDYSVPVIFGVLATENKKQALNRIDAAKMNKGDEFAQAAVEMAAFRA